MSFISVQSVSKSFGKQNAVSDLSFGVEPGEIFGLLGPNGAGKTTTIRMVLDLLKPDSGTIAVLGGPLDEAKKDRIGYMPEDAGLYGEMRLLDCVVYLATLKNVLEKTARQRAEEMLTRLDLYEHRKKKVRELSRGLYQKTQMVAATLHDPDLLIVDEPFANLDPVNTQLIKDLLLERRTRGKSVVMSSHQMYLVETMCDRIALIYQGKAVIYGPMKQVKRQFGRNAVRVVGQGEFASLPGVVQATHGEGGQWLLTLTDATSSADILRSLAAHPEWEIERFEIALPSLDEIFIRTVGGVNPYDY